MLSASFFMAIFSSGAHALSKEEVAEEYFRDWYQVEIVVFEHDESQGDDQESWPKNISLSYPARLEFLKEKADTETLIPADERTLKDDEANSILLENLRKVDPNDPLNKRIINAIVQSELERNEPKQKPYILLDKEERILNNDALAIARERSYKVLFHQAWRQPIVDIKDTSSVVILGGQRFDQHNELEGSITLSVSRYLHAHTNLWLSEFEPNFGQELKHWPQLPSQPRLVTPIDTETNTQALELDGIEGQRPMSIGNELTFPVNETEPHTDNLLGEGSLNSNTLFNRANSDAAFGDYSTIAEQPFLTKYIVTMKQKRRMRSDELHYIDHPKFGILIKVDKYLPPTEAE
jgi:hypothetical protein